MSSGHELVLSAEYRTSTDFRKTVGSWQYAARNKYSVKFKVLREDSKGQSAKSLTAETQSTQREEVLPNRETTIGQKS